MVEEQKREIEIERENIKKNSIKLYSDSCPIFESKVFYKEYQKKDEKESKKDIYKPLNYCLKYSKKNNLNIVLQYKSPILKKGVYTSIKNIKLLNKVLDKNLNIFELLTTTTPTNLFFDIDIPKRRVAKSEARIIKNFDKVVKETFKELYNEDLKEPLIKEANRTTKFSNHILYHTNKKFRNAKSIRHFINKLKENIENNKTYQKDLKYKDKKNKELKYIFDECIYRNNTLFRCINQTKAFTKNQRTKNPKFNQLEEDKEEVDNKEYLVGYYSRKPTNFYKTNEEPQEPQPTTQEEKVVETKPKEEKTIFELVKFDEAKRNNKNTPTIKITNYKDLLFSIPNSGEYRQIKRVWKAILYSFKRIGGKKQDFINWTCDDNDNQTSEIWDEANKSNKGYGYTTLLKIANTANKIMMINTIKQLNTPKTKYNKITNTKYFLERENHIEDIFDNYKVLIGSANLGGGKSYSICNYIKNHKEIKKVIIITPRITHAKSITDDFNKKTNRKFRLYQNIKKKEEYKSVDNIVVQLESINKLDEQNNIDFDLIVVDEIESVLNQFTSPTLKGILKKTVRAFERIFRASKKIYLADAFLTERTYEFISNILEYDRSDFKNNIYSIENYQKTNREVIIYDNSKLPLIMMGKGNARKSSMNKFLEKFIELLTIKKKKIYFICSSKKKLLELVEKLDQDHPNIKYLEYHANKEHTKKTKETPIKELWKKYNLIITTTSISVGLDYKFDDIEDKEKHNFDCVFMYCSSSCGVARDLYQSAYRARELKDKKVYMFIDDRIQNYKVPNGIKATIESYEAYEERNKKILETNKESCKKYLDYEDILYYNCPYWLKITQLWNKNEEFLNMRFYKLIHLQYLKRIGYKIKIIDDFDPEYYTFLDLNIPEYIKKKYEAIKDITKEEFENLSLKAKTINLSFDEWDEISKYNFNKYIVKKETPNNIKGWLFDEFYNNYKQDKLKNLKLELTNIYHFELVRDFKNKYIIFGKNQAQQHQIINKIKKIFKLKTYKQGTIIKREDIEANLEKLIELCKEAKETFQILIQRKKKGLKSVEDVVEVINTIFNKWSIIKFDKKLNRRRNKETGKREYKPIEIWRVKYKITKKQIKEYEINIDEFNIYDWIEPYKAKVKNLDSVKSLIYEYSNFESYNNCVDNLINYNLGLEELRQFDNLLFDDDEEEEGVEPLIYKEFGETQEEFEERKRTILNNNNMDSDEEEPIEDHIIIDNTIQPTPPNNNNNNIQEPIEELEVIEIDVDEFEEEDDNIIIDDKEEDVKENPITNYGKFKEKKTKLKPLGKAREKTIDNINNMIFNMMNKDKG